eukprot:7173231-Prymnesium_polylepis.1
MELNVTAEEAAADASVCIAAAGAGVMEVETDEGGSYTDRPARRPARRPAGRPHGRRTSGEARAR